MLKIAKKQKVMIIYQKFFQLSKQKGHDYHINLINYENQF